MKRCFYKRYDNFLDKAYDRYGYFLEWLLSFRDIYPIRLRRKLFIYYLNYRYVPVWDLHNYGHIKNKL